MRYDEDDDYYRHEDRTRHVSIGETRAHDRYLDPPDDPECPECEKKDVRVTELEECLEWVAQHLGRITFLRAPAGGHKVVLLPWDTQAPIDGATRLEALEKLWKENQ